MFKDVLNFNPNTRAALRDPATAIRQGLPRLLEQIRKDEKEINKLTADLKRIQSEIATQKKGWFSSEPREPGMLDRWAINSTESSIETYKQEIAELRQAYDFLSQPMYPNSAQWTFEQVDEEISKLYRRLAGSYASLEAMTEPGRQLQNQPASFKFKTGDDGEQEVPNLLAGLNALFGAIIPQEGFDVTLLTVCKMAVELQGLYAQRRSLFKAYQQDIATWGKSKLEVELRKRQRDLEDLPAELRQQKDYAHLADLSAIAAAMLEQRRFLEDLVFELEGALTHYQAPSKTSDPTEDLLNEIKELKRKRDAALANETDPELRDAIKQAYGKKIDVLREKL